MKDSIYRYRYRYLIDVFAGRRKRLHFLDIPFDMDSQKVRRSLPFSFPHYQDPSYNDNLQRFFAAEEEKRYYFPQKMFDYNRLLANMDRNNNKVIKQKVSMYEKMLLNLTYLIYPLFGRGKRLYFADNSFGMVSQKVHRPLPFLFLHSQDPDSYNFKNNQGKVKVFRSYSKVHIFGSIHLGKKNK